MLRACRCPLQRTGQGCSGSIKGAGRVSRMDWGSNWVVLAMSWSGVRVVSRPTTYQKPVPAVVLCLESGDGSPPDRERRTARGYAIPWSRLKDGALDLGFSRGNGYPALLYRVAEKPTSKYAGKVGLYPMPVIFRSAENPSAAQLSSAICRTLRRRPEVSCARPETNIRRTQSLCRAKTRMQVNYQHGIARNRPRSRPV
jgi:hypothetical protein